MNESKGHVRRVRRFPNFLKLLPLLLFLVLLPGASNAASDQVTDIFYDGTIVLDRDGVLDYRQALEKAKQAEGGPRQRVPSSGNVYWVYDEVENTDGPSEWWVEVFAVRSDYVDLYVLKDGVLEQHRRGGLIPVATEEKALKSMGSHVLSFTLPVGEKRTLLLRVQSRSLINYTINAGPEYVLNNERSKRHFAVYMLMGGMFALILYNIVIGFDLRDLDYLLYSLHGASYFAFFFNSYGFASTYLGLTNHPWFTVFSALALEFFGMLFVWRFLRVWKWNRILSHTFLGFLGLTLLIFVLSPILEIQNMSTVWMAMYVIVPILVITSSILGIRASVRQAWYVLAGWTPMTAMTLVAIVAMFGLLDKPPSGAVINASVFVEMLVLSLALADRIRQLRRERLIAEKESQEKSSFLAMLSHEVRTPLNGILGTVELLRQGNLSGKQRNLVANVSHAGHALLTLLNDVLDLSKSAAGKLEVHPASVDPQRLSESMVDLMQARASEKGIQLQFRSVGDIPAAALLDETRIRQVLLNLVSNAIKFTDGGEVNVSLTGRRMAADTYALTWEVADTGIGISPGDQERLFEPFTQADSSSTRGFEGVGLGLAICKDLVDLMGGSIDVESEPGKGSRFSFALEVEGRDIPEDSNAQNTRDLPPHLRATLQSIRVLIVDDIALNREVLGDLLRHQGFRVDLAENGEQALKMAEEIDYQAVVLDIYMPAMNGFQIARALRKGGSKVPIIGLTAAMEADIRDTARESGMDRLLSKPADTIEMRDEILALNGIAVETEDDALVDRHTVFGIVEKLGNPYALGLLRQFENLASEKLDLLDEHMEQQRSDLAGEELHRLAGAALLLGVKRLGKLAERSSAGLRKKPAGGNLRADLEALRGVYRLSLAELRELERELESDMQAA